MRVSVKDIHVGLSSPLLNMILVKDIHVGLSSPLLNMILDTGLGFSEFVDKGPLSKLRQGEITVLGHLLWRQWLQAFCVLTLRKIKAFSFAYDFNENKSFKQHSSYIYNYTVWVKKSTCAKVMPTICIMLGLAEWDNGLNVSNEMHCICFLQS